MAKTKVEIHEFDPVICPYRIWIVIDKTPDIIAEKFKEYNGDPVLFTDKDGNNRQLAFTMMVQHKEEKRYGTAMFFRSKKSMSYKLVAHESSHAAKQLFEHISADIKEHEPFEYVIGWIAGCCEKVKKNN